MAINPIIPSDYPDPDVIRVDDTYYMASTTMHFFPGCALLRSYDLINWEIAGYVYDKLDDNFAERMEHETSIYGKGMWAPCLRYFDGTFYVVFYSATTKKTYVFTSSAIDGEWKKSTIEGTFYDCSILFDGGKKYIVHGHRDIYITELEDDMSKPKEGGLNRLVISETNDVILPYEGSHVHKIGSKYYIFLIHWPTGGMRTESCFVSDSLEGEFVGRDILSDDRNYCGQGVAQGGIIDTPTGKWYAVLFQDSGAVGRMPIIVPVTFDESGFPIFGVNGKVPDNMEIPSSRPYYVYEDLYTSELYDNSVPAIDDAHPVIKKQWQWNHQPSMKRWERYGDNGIRIFTDKIASNLSHAANTLTQRTMWPGCEAEVTVDASDMNNGDVAGLCMLQGNYGYLAITKEAGYYYLIKVTRSVRGQGNSGKNDYLPGAEECRIRLDGPKATLRLNANFGQMTDRMDFFYIKNDRFVKVGDAHKLEFKLDHFVGARFGLFIYSTRKRGGSAVFENFRYKYYGAD